jgi:hypothetical protein
MGTKIIIGMAVATVASAIMQGIFSSVGKQTEAQYLDLATKSGLAATAIGVFVKAISAIRSLG